MVGSTRSDVATRSDVRLRVPVSRDTYRAVQRRIRALSRSWIAYHLLLRNCNAFVGDIAQSVGLRTPRSAARYPTVYLSELRALNVR
jgi:hypothetical protein